MIVRFYLSTLPYFILGGSPTFCALDCSAFSYLYVLLLSLVLVYLLQLDPNQAFESTRVSAALRSKDFFHKGNPGYTYRETQG